MNFKIQLAQDITLTEADGQAVLFSKKTGDFFGLNESAAILLKELSQSDFTAAVAYAAKTFAAPAEELSADLVELVDELEKQNLLTRIQIP